MKNIAGVIRQAWGALTPKTKTMGGFLGNPLGVVAVPGRKDFAYVRLRNGEVMEAYNPDVQDIFGLEVDLEYKNGTYRVLEPREVYNTRSDYRKINIDSLQWPGSQTLYIARQQFLPGLVAPLEGLTVRVLDEAHYTVAGGVARLPAQNVDLSDYVPVSGACWVVLSITPAGGLDVTAGAPVTPPLEYGHIPLGSVPTLNKPLAAVKLWAGQTHIYQTKYAADTIVDLRFAVAGGGGGGGALFTLVDLTPQIDGVKTAFTVSSDEIQSVYWNGVRQYAADYSVTGGILTTAFTPVPGDTLVATLGEAAGFFSWGMLTGEIANQADLAAELNAKISIPGVSPFARVWKGAGFSPLTWGDVGGTLEHQVDLRNALAAKLEAVNWGGVGGTLANQLDLQAALNQKLEDAPSNGKKYGRENGAWVEVKDRAWLPPLAASFSTNISGDATYLNLSDGNSGLNINPMYLSATDAVRAAERLISPLSGVWTMTAHLSINMSALDNMGFGLHLRSSQNRGIAFLVTNGWAIKVRKFSGTDGVKTSAGDLYSQSHLMTDAWLRITWSVTATTFMLGAAKDMVMPGVNHHQLHSINHADWFLEMPRYPSLAFWSNRADGKANAICDYFSLEHES